MRLATFNVNSLRSRMTIVKDWLTAHNPDFLCLQETKVQDADFPKEEIESWGYHVTFTGQKSYNGVAILSKTAPDEILRGFDDGLEPKCETRLLACRYGDLWLVDTYVPQGKSIDHADYEFKKEFLRRMPDFIARRGGKVLWCGDFNVAPTPLDVANPKTKTKHVCYYKELRDLYAGLTAPLVDLFRRYHEGEELYTFFDYRVKDSLDRNLGWRIDHVLATPEAAESCTGVWVDHSVRRLEKPSDHTPVVADFL